MLPPVGGVAAQGQSGHAEVGVDAYEGVDAGVLRLLPEDCGEVQMCGQFLPCLHLVLRQAGVGPADVGQAVACRCLGRSADMGLCGPHREDLAALGHLGRHVPGGAGEGAECYGGEGFHGLRLSVGR